MKKNVLVFPCGSEIGLEIHESVRYSTHFKLIGASSVKDHGSFVYDNYIEDVPNVDDKDFIERINQIVATHKIDYIFPAHDSVVLALSEARAAGKIDCIVVTSPFDTCKIARSKSLTYEVLKDVVKVPELYDIKNINYRQFPIFMKPDVGQGSKGVYKVQDIEEAMFYKNHDSTLLSMEYLPGLEYTVDCFTDHKGNLKYCSGRVRRRVSNGISVNTETIEDVRFFDFAQKIQSKITFNGAWFFQVKENANNEFVLMEFAPRIAGTMGHDRVYGVNLALLSLFNSAKRSVNVFKNDNVTVVTDRSLKAAYSHDIQFNHAYLDLDDLLIYENQINTRIVAFIYQCHNKNIKVYLLTKHLSDIDETLKKYRISNLFDDIIQIKDSDEKYKYVIHEDSIFVDDSNDERQKVHEKLNIPVFDAHSIEVLIEY